VNSDATFLPYARQMIDDDDIAAVTSVLRGDFLTSGPMVQDFEEKLTQVTSASFAICCSSGTAALHLTALALELQPGDAVIVPSITFLATANAVRYVGAEVIFADVDASTGLMTPENFDQALKQDRKNIKAVFPVHLGGQTPDMSAIHKIAKQNGLAIVEDASHAIGSTYSCFNGEANIGACVHSDMATFSFHPAKTIAMGEGGAITTQSPILAKRLRLLLNHGMTREPADFVNKELAFEDGKEDGKPNPWYYEMHEMGFNYRASDIHCALGLKQLSKLDSFVTERRTLVSYYDKLLAPLVPLVQSVARVSGGNPAWHLYQVLIDFDTSGVTRTQLMEVLRHQGISTQVHYIPVPYQPYYRDRYSPSSLPGAESFYKRCLSLPLFVGMDYSHVERVTAALGRALNT